MVRQRLSLDCYENSSTMIDPLPETRYVVLRGMGRSAYENLDIPNLRLEEGLPTSFDASKRNIVVLDDLMAENRRAE